MAIWLPNSKDDSSAPVCYVSCLPRADFYDGNTGDFPGPGRVIENRFDYPTIADDFFGSFRAKYMFYCCRMIQYLNVNISTGSIDVSSATKSVHSTTRFGDLGGYYIKRSNLTSPPTYTLIEHPGVTDNNSAFARYRFPAEIVPYHNVDRRGFSYGQSVMPSNLFPFSGRTCAFIPDKPDPGFHWLPENDGTLGIISSNLLPNLTSLNNTNQNWNLCIVAWMWAGTAPADITRDGTPGNYTYTVQVPKRGLQPTTNSAPISESEKNDLRQVSECDKYYMAYMF